jgi:uncharacterized protein (TIGR01244 family)
MKATIVEQDFAVAPQITTADIAEMVREGIKTLINNRPDNEEPGQLASADAKAAAEKLGLTYLYLPVRTDTITAGDVDAFARALKGSAKPILAHCRSGTRCYLLWAATQATAGKDVNQLVMRAAGDGYDIRVLPDLMRRIGKT